MSRVLVLALVAGLAACSGADPASPPAPPPPPPPPPSPAVVATVDVAPGTADLLVGETAQLQATVKDAQGNVLTDRTVTWSSDKLAIATVAGDGRVTGVSPGSAAITALVEGKSGSAQISVASPLPEPACRDCLEVVPSSLLLTEAGAEQQLQAFLVDQAGARTPVTANFTSARPEVVSVTADGLARAAALGSATLTATAGGKTATPILALVATPVPGAVLVRDEQVRGPLTPVDPDAPLATGYRYRVQLRDVQLAVGQLIVGTGGKPVGGRVVAVTPAGSNRVDVELELRPLVELVPNLSVNETWRVPADEPLAGAPRSGPWRAAREDEPLGEGEFRLGPFACKADAGAQVSFPLNLVVETLEANPLLDAELVMNGAQLERLMVSGQVSPHLVLTPKLTAGIEGSLECRKTLRRPRLPVSGLLALVVSPRVPIGIGFKFDAKAQLAELGFKLDVAGQLGLQVGQVCQGGQCNTVWEPITGLSGRFEPILHGLGDTRVELAASAFAFVKLEFTNPIAELIEEATDDRIGIQLFEAKAGLKQKLDMATAAAQADDPDYAAGVELSAFAEAAFGASVELGGLLSIQLLEVKREASVPLASTPKGTVVPTPATVQVPPGGEPGEPATLRVILDPVTYMGAYAVEGVEIFWKNENGLTNVCGFMEPASPGQREFECELEFTEEHLGRQTFHAFVTAKIFGIPFPTPFEIARDSRVSVDILREATLLLQTTLLPDGTVGLPYSVQLQAFGGGNGPMQWSVVAGLLPAGLSLNPVTGRITGTPTQACTCGITIEVTRSAQRASRDLTLTVTGPSMLGAWSGEWRMTAGGHAGRTFAVAGEIEPWNGGEFGNHLFGFREVINLGNGACGLNINGSSVTIVGQCEARWSGANGSQRFVATGQSFSGSTFTATFVRADGNPEAGQLVMRKVTP